MIIGISGKKQHGKDTVANMIQYIICLNKEGTLRHHERGFEEFLKAPRANDIQSGWSKRQFAGKLKQIVALLIGCTLEQLEDNEFKEKPLGIEWDAWMRPNNTPYPSLFPINVDKDWLETNGRHLMHRQLTPRRILQIMGTEAGRNIIHPNVWVNATMADYKRQPHSGPTRDLRYPNWIITDVRFPNEVKAIKEKGGLVIRVENSRIVSEDKHESETALDSFSNFDDIIQNNGSIEELRQEVLSFLKAFQIL